MRSLRWYAFDKSLQLCMARSLKNDIQIPVRGEEGQESWTSGLAGISKPRKEGVIV